MSVSLRILQAAYAMLLLLPHDEVRLRIQPVLAALRDEIANHHGMPSEHIQSHFEALATATKEAADEAVESIRQAAIKAH